jgi:hypothetical protein
MTTFRIDFYASYLSTHQRHRDWRMCNMLPKATFTICSHPCSLPNLSMYCFWALHPPPPPPPQLTLYDGGTLGGWNRFQSEKLIRKIELRHHHICPLRCDSSSSGWYSKMLVSNLRINTKKKTRWDLRKAAKYKFTCFKKMSIRALVWNRAGKN